MVTWLKEFWFTETLPLPVKLSVPVWKPVTCPKESKSIALINLRLLFPKSPVENPDGAAGLSW